jgi:hypothetical protein
MAVSADVIGPVIVAVHVHGNETVGVIGAPLRNRTVHGSDHDHGVVPVHVHRHDHG